MHLAVQHILCTPVEVPDLYARGHVRATYLDWISCCMALCSIQTQAGSKFIVSTSSSEICRPCFTKLLVLLEAAQTSKRAMQAKAWQPFRHHSVRLP